MTGCGYTSPPLSHLATISNECQLLALSFIYRNEVCTTIMKQMPFFNASDHANTEGAYGIPICYATTRTVASSARAKYSTLPSFSPAIDMREVLAM